MKLKEIDYDLFEKELDGIYAPKSDEDVEFAHRNGLASLRPLVENFDALNLGDKFMSYKNRKGDEELYKEFGEGRMTFEILVKLAESIDEIPGNEKSLFIISTKLMDDIDTLRLHKGIGPDYDDIFTDFKNRVKSEVIAYNYVVYVYNTPGAI